MVGCDFHFQFPKCKKNNNHGLLRYTSQTSGDPQALRTMALGILCLAFPALHRLEWCNMEREWFRSSAWMTSIQLMKWWVQHRLLSNVEERKLAQHLGSTLHGIPKADLYFNVLVFIENITLFLSTVTLWYSVLVIISLFRVWFWNSHKYRKFVQIGL